MVFKLDENAVLFSLIPFAAFFFTLVFTPVWMRAAKNIKLVGKDINKPNRPEVPEMGGITVVLGFSFAILLYVGFKIFYFQTTVNVIELFALLSSALIVAVVGMLDDILGWQVGLKQWQKPLLTIPAAIPMMVVNAGQSTMSFPFLGSVDFGLLYPLLIVPVGIVGAANVYNMFAGFNGLEAGLGVVIFATLGVISFEKAPFVALICATMVASLLAFLKFNWFPARVFAGDTLTYFVGAMAAIVAVLGDMEAAAVLLFLPYFADFAVKWRNKLPGKGWSGAWKNGKLYCPDSGPVHLAQYAMIWANGVSEKNLVLSFIAFEVLLGFIALFLFSGLV
ncbi:MAG TPA: glycosyl transferase family 4 [archaeon]|nr:glycosyl transferase family 4 [archaeon]